MVSMSPLLPAFCVSLFEVTGPDVLDILDQDLGHMGMSRLRTRVFLLVSDSTNLKFAEACQCETSRGCMLHAAFLPPTVDQGILAKARQNQFQWKG